MAKQTKGKGGKDDGKGGGKDDVKTKWEGRGYLDGLSDAEKEKLADLMESAEADFQLNPTYNTPISVATTNGRVDFDLTDIVFKGMRNSFDQKQDPDGTTFDHTLVWTELQAECAAMAESFYGKNSGVDFDPTEHHAFAAKFGYAFAIRNLKRPTGR